MISRHTTAHSSIEARFAKNNCTVPAGRTEASTPKPTHINLLPVKYVEVHAAVDPYALMEPKSNKQRPSMPQVQNLHNNDRYVPEEYVFSYQESATSYAVTQSPLHSPVKHPHRGVPCSQDLLPGMHSHWGEHKLCEAHAPNNFGIQEFYVCKGCRVNHHMREDDGFNRWTIMSSGARVPVCEDCAIEVVRGTKVGDPGCCCDVRWTCFACREEELRKLAKARENYGGGRSMCGRCMIEKKAMDFVEICLSCEKLRIYTMKNV